MIILVKAVRPDWRHCELSLKETAFEAPTMLIRGVYRYGKRLAK